MTVGPLERFALRIEQLEQALGMKPRPLDLRTGRRGRLGPGGKKLLAMLRGCELDRSEEDALGHALEAEQRGQMRRAQEWLDHLSYSIQLRKKLERANSGDGRSSEAGSPNDPKD